MRIKSQDEWLQEKIFEKEDGKSSRELRRKEIFNKEIKLGRIKDYEVDLQYNEYRKHMMNEILLDRESKGDDQC